MLLFFFKQKTAYEMRISDWRSDVCSSDLPRLSENEHIAWREKVRIDERAEYMELIKIAEQERAEAIAEAASLRAALQARAKAVEPVNAPITFPTSLAELEPWAADRKSTRLNSSH